MQTRALQSLRYTLTRYQEGDMTISPTMLSLTALTCAISELIANKSWDNFNRHLLGVGALIFHGGVAVSGLCLLLPCLFSISRPSKEPMSRVALEA
jgi:hypothetical protein